MHLALRPCSFAFASPGNNNDARIAMIAITTSNSINVNPAPFLIRLHQPYPENKHGIKDDDAPRSLRMPAYLSFMNLLEIVLPQHRSQLILGNCSSSDAPRSSPRIRPPFPDSKHSQRTSRINPATKNP